jgi:5'-nucleotidase
MTLESGEPVQLDKTYRVVMPDFVAGGGDGTSAVMEAVSSDNIQIYYARPIRDVLVEQLRKRQQPLQPKTEGRITILNWPAR